MAAILLKKLITCHFFTDIIKNKPYFFLTTATKQSCVLFILCFFYKQKNEKLKERGIGNSGGQRSDVTSNKDSAHKPEHKKA